MLITESRTAEFLDWLGTAPGPIADVLRDRAAELAARWRVGSYTRREKGSQCMRWLEQEVSDAQLLRSAGKDRLEPLTDNSLLLREKAMEFLVVVPNAWFLDRHEVVTYIESHY